MMAEMTAAQVLEEYKAQPPLMRPTFAKKYVGIEVDWSVLFADAWKEKSKVIRIAFHVDSPGFGAIMGSVRREDYPQLERLHAREPLRVRGRIRSVSIHWVELEITELLFCVEGEPVLA